MKVTMLEVENYKKVRKIVIAPGDRSTILIGGKNRVGKSSLIGAMSAALGGGKEVAEQPIRKGAKSADIKVSLDDEKLGDIVVHRRFLKSGTSRLEITTEEGKLTAPQKVLDRIIGARFLDPLKFSRLSGKEQREVLIKCVDLGIDLDKHAATRKEVFADRTNANRIVKTLIAQLEANPDPGKVPDQADPDELLAKLEDLTERDAARLTAQHDLETMRSSLGAKKGEVATSIELLESRKAGLDELLSRHKQEIQIAQEGIEQAGKRVTACNTAVDEFVEAGKAQAAKAEKLAKTDLTEEIENAKVQIRKATASNQERTVLLAQKERHDRAVTVLEEARTEVESLSTRLDSMDSAKALALEDAKMPIDGLDIDEEFLLYNDVPLSQASGAEQLQVSLAIAAALAPALKDIWVQDGALLDTDSLKLVDDFAKKNDLRIWLERVGESDDDVIIIEDGVVRT